MKPLSHFEALLGRSVGSVLAPGGRRGSLLVLIYHSVLPAPDPIITDEPDADRFAAQMDLVRELFNVLPLSEAVERLARRSLPPRAACITFDDGYANNCEVAAPILKARGLTATFFVATGYLDGGRMWNDTVIESVRLAGEVLDLDDLGLGRFLLTDAAARTRAIDELLGALKYREPQERLRLTEAMAERVGLGSNATLMMTEAQVRQLVSLGMEVGAHSVSHPILTRVDAESARSEIFESRARLEAIVRGGISLFAYPNGRPARDYDRSHVEMVRAAGFKAAVSTAWGKAKADTDLYQIPRIAPWDQSSRRYATRMLASYLQGAATRV